MCGFLVVALTMEGVDTILVVGVAAPTWGFVLELRDDQMSLLRRTRANMSLVRRWLRLLRYMGRDEREGGVLA